MEECYNGEKIKQKQKKQEYLRKNILEAHFDPSEFSFFMESKKPDGSNIDNWSLDELESVVFQYKKFANEATQDEKILYNLETLDIDCDENNVYYETIPTVLKQETAFSGQKNYVMIDQAEVVQNGIFSFKTIQYTIVILTKNQSILRMESDFKILQNILEVEFPFIPLPPLQSFSEKSITPESVKLTKKNHEKYLNEIMRHPILRSSLILEAFLIEENFDKKSKIVKKQLNKIYGCQYSTQKKTYDTYNGDECLKSIPTIHGQLETKLSPLINKHFSSSESQYHIYEQLFSQLEIVHKEFQKHLKRLMEVNLKFRDIFVDFQNHSRNCNLMKEVQTVYNQLQAPLFSSVAAFFNNHDKFIQKMSKIYDEQIGQFSQHMKQYVINVKNKIIQRNYIKLEWEKNNKFLTEKKIKKITMNLQAGDIQDNLLIKYGLDRDMVIKNHQIAKKLLFPEETQKMTSFTKLYGVFNHSIFKELLYFEEFFIKNLVGTFNQFASRSTQNLTECHVIFADLLQDFSETNKVFINGQFNQYIEFFETILTLVNSNGISTN